MFFQIILFKINRIFLKISENSPCKHNSLCFTSLHFFACPFRNIVSVSKHFLTKMNIYTLSSILDIESFLLRIFLLQFRTEYCLFHKMFQRDCSTKCHLNDCIELFEFTLINTFSTKIC